MKSPYELSTATKICDDIANLAWLVIVHRVAVKVRLHTA